MFKQLQAEHAAWALKNFGEQDVEDYELGLIAKSGALAIAVLKRKQWRGCTEDHDAKIRDAVGDITIYLVGFCNIDGIDAQSADDMVGQLIDKQSVVDISASIHNLFNYGSQFEVTDLLNCMKCFCAKEGIDYEQTVKETWVNVVSKRDWKNNPDQVAAERLGEYCDFGYPI